MLDLRGETPFETGEESLLDVLEFNRRSIGSKDQLFAALLEIVEDMEEGILGSFETREILNIIHNQHIYRLIEIEEIGDAVALRSVLILELEGVCAHVEHTRMRIEQLNLISDGVCQVGLSYSATAIDEERVESCVARLFGNRYAGCTCQFIRFSRYKRIKGIIGIELGVEVIRTDRRVINYMVRLRLCARGRKHGSCSGGGVNQDAVLEMGALPEDADDGCGEERYIVLLYIFRDELRFHLEDKNAILELQRHNGCEPCLVGTSGQIVGENSLTLTPLLL